MDLFDYGFKWGPAEIVRLIAVPGRGRVLSVKTDHAELQILISEKGRKLRVWRGNQELKETA
jgi:hypothetical protein